MRLFLRPKKSHRVQTWASIQPINRSLTSKRRTALRHGRSAEQKKLKSLGPSPTMEMDLQRLPEVPPKGNFKPDVGDVIRLN